MKNVSIKNHTLVISLLSGILLLVLLVLFYRNYQEVKYGAGLAMMASIKQQLSIGDRNVGSTGHRKAQDFIISQLGQSGVYHERQTWIDTDGQELTNIVGRINPANPRRAIVGTHYDTRPGIPGANDGASAVAVLLQLAKEPELGNLGIDLVFFDAEEYNPGSYDDWRPKGSTHFSENLPPLYPSVRPEFVMVPDLVCKKNLLLKREEGSRKSAPNLTNDLWQTGQQVDRSVFSDQEIGEVKDDHTPLNIAGIPSVLMIDLNYPQFHTKQDDLDKCSPKSLEAVFQTIKKFLIEYDGN